MRIRLKHQNLAEVIARSRRSQNGWAKHLDLSPAYLSRLVNGKRPFPSPETRQKLLQGFALEFDDLFEIDHAAGGRTSPVIPPSPPVELDEERKGLKMLDLPKDFSYALRLIIRKPLFAGLVVLTLALGIGANVAVYSVVHHAFFKPLPFPDDQELAVLWNRHGIGQTALSPLQLRLFQESGVARQVGAASMQNYQLLSGGDPLRVPSAEVTPDFLPLLTPVPGQGRYFVDEEFQPGQNRSFVMTHAFFQTRFGGDVSKVGQMIDFGRGEYRLVGVLPPNFRLPWEVDLFFPLVIPESYYQPGQWGQEFLRIVARLQPPVSPEAAQTRLNEIFQQQVPERYARGQRISVISLREQLVGESESALWALLLAALVVFLIASSNVANLFLVRAEGRKEEFAIRVAMGAGRLRVFRQLVCESALLSLLGCILGLGLAGGALALVNTSPFEALRPLRGASIDWSVMVFGMLLLVLTCLFFGLVPTLHLSNRPVGVALKSVTARTATSFKFNYLRRGLVTAEVALAIVLAIAVALLLQSFLHLRAVDPGFRSEGVLSGRIELPANRYSREQAVAFYDQLRDNLEGYDAVEQVAFAYALPLSGIVWSASFDIAGQVTDPDGPQPSANIRPVSSNYFAVMGIGLIEGRVFDESDRPGTPLSVVIDEVVAQKYWPEGTAIGQQIEDLLGRGPATVVGVVRSVKDMGLQAESHGHLYWSLEQLPGVSQRAALLKAKGNLDGLAPLLRSEVQNLDPTLPVFELQSLEQKLEDATTGRRLGLALIGVFAGVSLLLAGIGVYGLTAYSVRQRTGELGIRMALGAGSGELMKMVLLEVSYLWAAGAVLGLLLAYFSSGVIRQFVYGISATDPISLVSVVLFLGVLTLLAAALPAHRAGRLTCLEALRYE